MRQTRGLGGREISWLEAWRAVLSGCGGFIMYLVRPTHLRSCRAARGVESVVVVEQPAQLSICCLISCTIGGEAESREPLFCGGLSAKCEWTDFFSLQ